jgi:hypothetical protein
MRRSGQPALPAVGGRRPPSDYSPRGAPHPRAAERIFPWGGDVNDSWDKSLSLSPLGTPPAPSAGPDPRAHGGGGVPSPHLPTHGLCPEALGRPPRTPPNPFHARRTSEPVEGRGLRAFPLSPAKLKARSEAAHGGPRRGGMEWEGRGRWHPRARALRLGATLQPLGRKRGWEGGWAGLGDRSVRGGARVGGAPASQGWGGGEGGTGQGRAGTL